MLIMIFTMLVVLVLAAGVIAVVVMGMEGTGRRQHPEIAEAMARTARHLNGEGTPPKALVQIFDEMDEVGDLNVRDLPDKLRSLGSAATAASARSARTAWSALSARSAASANPPEVDESAVQAMGAALDAQATIDLEAADPYGVWAVGDAEQFVDGDAGSAGDSGSAGDTDPTDDGAEVAGDTVVRVHLPEGEVRA